MSRRKPKASYPAAAQQVQPFDYGAFAQEVVKAQIATQHIPAMVSAEIQKGWKQLPNPQANHGAKSWFYDPLSLQYSMGYKDKRFSLTYDTLRRIAGQLSIISGILNTRAAQVATFAQPYRQTKSLGFVIRHKDTDRLMSPAELAFAKELEQFVMNCGKPEKNPYSRIQRDDFETFLRKIVRDSLVLDQACAEIVHDRNRIPYEFYAVDGGTIRIAADDRFGTIADSYHARSGFVPDPPHRFASLYENKQYGFTNAIGERVEYVQVVYGQIENVYSSKELAFGVRNPRTDIYVQGYGFAELEQLVTIVTGHLFAEEYNRAFFCATPDTYVTTDRGLVQLVELAGQEFRIWNGRDWRPARALETGEKPLVRTKLKNGIELKTSPEHWYRVLPRESAQVEWRQQKNMQQGDVALLGYQATEGQLDLAALHVGKEYKSEAINPAHVRHWIPTKAVVEDLEFWEMVGFALGDGYWPPRKGAKGDAKWFGLFPHHTKDKELFDKFLAVCARHDIHGVLDTINKHHTRVTDGESGYPIIRIAHYPFAQWLHDLGFRPSSEERQIPALLFRLPISVRCAVLRGLFSADGHRHQHPTGYCTPTVFSACGSFRQDIVKLLWSVGVAAAEDGSGWDRREEVRIQDIPEFVAKIRYLQDYKNEDTQRADQSKDRWDVLHAPLSVLAASEIRAHANWSTLSDLDRDLVCKASRQVCRMSRPRALRIMAQLSMAIPEAMHYVQVPVDVLDSAPIGKELMFDIEVFDTEHVYLANHIAVHNTQSSAPKGILNFKGDNWTPEQLEAFRRQWMAMVSGVENAWKMPIVQSEGLEWHEMSKTNQEMEFGSWVEYLIKVSCGVFLIDPAELNFDLHGGVQQTPLFESSQEWKLKASRDRGLKPLLKFIAKFISKNIIDQIDDHFTFEFVGLDELSEQEKHELIVEQIASYMTLNEARKSLGLPPLPNGDIPMNPVYLQAQQMEQQNQMMQQQMAMQPQPGAEEATPVQQALPPAPKGSPAVTPPMYSANFGVESGQGEAGKKVLPAAPQ